MILKFIYTLFVSILVALFIGIGIAAFYEQPKAPVYPNSIKYTTPITSPTDATVSAQIQQDQAKYDQLSKQFEELSQKYNRNVSIIALVSAIIILVISLTMIKNIPLIADGVLLGGVYTVLYSIVRGFSTNDNKFRFLIVTIGLIISLILGYIKFIKPTKKI